MIAKSETKEKMLTAEERDSLRIRTRLLWFVKLGSLLSLCLAAFGEIARSYVSLAELIPTALAPVSINYCLPCALEVVPTLNTVLLGNFAVTYGCDSIAMSYGAPSMNNTHHYWSDCQALFRNRKFSSFFFFTYNWCQMSLHGACLGIDLLCQVQEYEYHHPWASRELASYLFRYFWGLHDFHWTDFGPHCSINLG